MLSSISVSIIIISKAMTDTNKYKYELLERSRGLWLSTIAFSMICRALTSYCPSFAYWSVKTRQFHACIGKRMYNEEEKKVMKEATTFFFYFFCLKKTFLHLVTGKTGAGGLKEACPGATTASTAWHFFHSNKMKKR